LRTLKKLKKQARFRAVESKYLNKTEKQKQINKHVVQKAHSLEARRSNSRLGEQTASALTA